MVSCFKRVASLSLLILALSCGQKGYAPSLSSAGPLAGDVTLYAGTVATSGTTDGPRLSARFSHPTGLVSDGTYLYVMDNQNFTIRRINLASGVVDTVAGTAGASATTDGTGAAARISPSGNMVLVNGNIYFAEYTANVIRKMNTTTFAVTTIAGTAGASGSTNGIGAAARFNFPNGIATDGTNIYVADLTNRVIRKIALSNFNVTTFAGTVGAAGSVDGVGAAARFRSPSGIVYGGGQLWVSDITTMTIRKLDPSSGLTTTVAGADQVDASTDGVGPAARFSSPQEIHYLNGYLYIAEPTNATVRMMNTSDNEVLTLAGSSGVTGAANGNGATASFMFPACMTSEGSSLYISDVTNETIRKID